MQITWDHMSCEDKQEQARTSLATCSCRRLMSCSARPSSTCTPTNRATVKSCLCQLLEGGLQRSEGEQGPGMSDTVIQNAAAAGVKG